jgi:hypothetical protein
MESKRSWDLLGAHGNDDGMTSIISARTPGAHIDLRRQYIHQLALPFVPPLRSQDDRDCYEGQVGSSVSFASLDKITRLNVPLISSRRSRIGLRLCQSREYFSSGCLRKS